MYNHVMDKDGLVEIIKRLLKTETDLGFPLNLAESDLITLVGCIRERCDLLRKQSQ